MIRKVEAAVKSIVAELYRDLCGSLTPARAAMIPENVLLYLKIVKNNICHSHSAEKELYAFLNQLVSIFPPRNHSLQRAPSPLLRCKDESGRNRLVSSEGAPKSHTLHLNSKVLSALTQSSCSIISVGGIGESLSHQLETFSQTCQAALAVFLRQEFRERVQEAMPRLAEQTVILLLTEKMSPQAVEDWVIRDIYSSELSVALLTELMRSATGENIRFTRQALRSNILTRNDLRLWLAFMKWVDLKESSVATELNALLLL